MSGNTERNNNQVPSLQVKSNAADNADVILWGDPTTHRLLVDIGSSSLTTEEIGHSAVGTVIDLVAMAGTEEQLASHPCKRVIITALPNNTGIIAIGDSSVVAALDATARGVLLFATQSQVFFITNTNLLYIDSSVSGEGVTYFYEN